MRLIDRSQKVPDHLYFRIHDRTRTTLSNLSKLLPNIDLLFL